MVIVNLDQVGFGDLMHFETATGRTIECIIGRTMSAGADDASFSKEKLIISLDFSIAMRVSTAQLMGLKFFKGLKECN